MSIFASILRSVYKLSGAKKAFALPEDTSAWDIPGTEDLKPYITAKDKGKKWLFGTVGMAVISAALAAMMSAFIH